MLAAPAARPSRCVDLDRAFGGNGAAPRAGAFWTGNGSITCKLTGLQPSTSYPVVAYRGSCAADRHHPPRVRNAEAH
jgi:hypothetical protein